MVSSFIPWKNHPVSVYHSCFTQRRATCHRMNMSTTFQKLLCFPKRYIILCSFMFQIDTSLILHQGNILLKPKSISFRWLLSFDSYLSAGTQHRTAREPEQFRLCWSCQKGRPWCRGHSNHKSKEESQYAQLLESGPTSSVWPLWSCTNQRMWALLGTARLSVKVKVKACVESKH